MLNPNTSLRGYFQLEFPGELDLNLVVPSSFRVTLPSGPGTLEAGLEGGTGEGAMTGEGGLEVTGRSLSGDGGFEHGSPGDIDEPQDGGGALAPEGLGGLTFPEGIGGLTFPEGVFFPDFLGSHLELKGFLAADRTQPFAHGICQT